MSGTKESCTCAYCRDGCSVKPGWFAPGEADKAAAHMGLPLGEFFAKYLAVDWWEADSEIPQTTFVLSPAIVGEDTGTEFPGDPRGRCVFYQDERCQIHPVKPVECRERWCGDKTPGRPVHREVAEAWAGHQDVIRELLGRDPEAEAYGGSIFGGLFGGWLA